MEAGVSFATMGFPLLPILIRAIGDSYVGFDATRRTVGLRIQSLVLKSWNEFVFPFVLSLNCIEEHSKSNSFIITGLSCLFFVFMSEITSMVFSVRIGL